MKKENESSWNILPSDLSPDTKQSITALENEFYIKYQTEKEDVRKQIIQILFGFNRAYLEVGGRAFKSDLRRSQRFAPATDKV